MAKGATDGFKREDSAVGNGVLDMHIPDDFAATEMAGVEERSPAMLSPKIDVDPGGAEQADNLLVETVVTGPH